MSEAATKSYPPPELQSLTWVFYAGADPGRLTGVLHGVKEFMFP